MLFPTRVSKAEVSLRLYSTSLNCPEEQLAAGWSSESSSQELRTPRSFDNLAEHPNRTGPRRANPKRSALHFGHQLSRIRDRMSIREGTVLTALEALLWLVGVAPCNPPQRQYCWRTANSVQPPTVSSWTRQLRAEWPKWRWDNSPSKTPTTPDVKEFAKRMVDDHSKANDQLKQLAAQEGVSLPSTLTHKIRPPRIVWRSCTAKPLTRLTCTTWC